MKLFPIQFGLLGWIEIDVAVNVAVAHPGSIRAYLESLNETAKYIEQRKTVASFHDELARRAGMDKRDVEAFLKSSVFRLQELEPATVLRLWKREVYAK